MTFFERPCRFLRSCMVCWNGEVVLSTAATSAAASSAFTALAATAFSTFAALGAAFAAALFLMQNVHLFFTAFLLGNLGVFRKLSKFFKRSVGEEFDFG